MRNRSFRMAQRQRKLSWARKVVRSQEYPNELNHHIICDVKFDREVTSKEEWEKEKDLRAHKMATTHTPCSCWMCGSPRKYFGEEKHSTKKKLLREKDE